MAMKRLLYVIPWLVALVVIAGALLILESELLWKVQEMNLFLTTFVGVLTGVGGGMLRDIFAGNMPHIFVKHFYARHADALRPLVPADVADQAHLPSLS